MVRYTPSEIHASPVAEGARVQIGTATAFAVRKESKDVALRIRRERRPMRAAMERTPFVRGMVRLVRSVLDFTDGLAESAELEPRRSPKGNRLEQRVAAVFRSHASTYVAFFSGVAAVILLVALLLALPMAIQRYVIPLYPLTRPAINAILCASRVLGGLIAAALLPQLRMMRRLCMYRGAINRVVNAYAASGKRVTQDAAMSASHVARKNDAAFVTAVLLLSIIAFAFVRIYTLPVQILVRVLIVLAVAAVVNEPIQALENAPRSPVRWLLAPHLLLGRLFVRRPSGPQVEVAVYAFNAALENDD